MFGVFKKKSKVEILQKKYKKLMKESFQLSTSSRRASEDKFAEAHKLLLEIESIQGL